RNLYNAFEDSKRRSLERILDPAVSRYPVPWLTTYAMRMQQLFGDLFPYGIEANRPTLELFLRYAHEQGIAHRLARPEDIFPAGLMGPVKILFLLCFGASARIPASVIFDRSIGVLRLPAFTSSFCIQLSLSSGNVTDGSMSPRLTVSSKA